MPVRISGIEWNYTSDEWNIYWYKYGYYIWACIQHYLYGDSDSHKRGININIACKHNNATEYTVYTHIHSQWYNIYNHEYRYPTAIK